MTRHTHQMDLRLGGNVQRYHTRPIIGVQTVAQHSWNLAQIVLSIYPDASRDLIISCLNHDAHEAITGDLSARAKRKFPKLREAYNEVEETVQAELGIELRFTHVEEEMVLWYADILECAYFALEQAKLGHRGVGDMFANALRTAAERFKAMTGSKVGSFHLLTGHRWTAADSMFWSLAGAGDPYFGNEWRQGL